MSLIECLVIAAMIVAITFASGLLYLFGPGIRWRISKFLANRRGRRLLISFIGQTAYERGQRLRHFDFRSPSNPHRIYRVPFSGLGDVVVWEGLCSQTLACIVPHPDNTDLPQADRVLAHYLHIITNEPTYQHLALRNLNRPSGGFS